MSVAFATRFALAKVGNQREVMSAFRQMAADKLGTFYEAPAATVKAPGGYGVAH